MILFQVRSRHDATTQKKKINLRPSNDTAHSLYFVRMANGHLSTKRRLIRKEIGTATLHGYFGYVLIRGSHERAIYTGRVIFFVALLQMTNL